MGFTALFSGAGRKALKISFGYMVPEGCGVAPVVSSAQWTPHCMPYRCQLERPGARKSRGRFTLRGI